MILLKFSMEHGCMLIVLTNISLTLHVHRKQNKKAFVCCYSSYACSHKPSLHVLPVHPLLQVQLSGAEQIPPFWQTWLSFTDEGGCTVTETSEFYCENWLVRTRWPIYFSGKLIMSRYVAESITTDARRFGHVGLCQLRTKLKILQ